MLLILKHRYMLGLIYISQITHFKSLEVDDRGSETQLEVAENLNFFTQCSEV